MVRKLLLLLLLIPVLAVAGGQVCREVYGGPGDTTSPGVVVPGPSGERAPGAGPTTAAPRPFPPSPSSGSIAVNH
ncbi:MAG TPA: hypothetical protein VGK98_01750 [Arthrobacter sp.]|jgi:hypothetical protein|uniref:hypothetical protein n=1 Tax=Arthrobacter sp. TaxID=1667 RepID=UPI002F41E6E5